MNFTGDSDAVLTWKLDLVGVQPVDLDVVCCLWSHSKMCRHSVLTAL